MNTSAAETVARRRAFRELHAAGCFVIPNPWDVGSARLLAGMGFKALATTSSGHAWSLGRSDGTQSVAEVVEHVRDIVEATALPVSADFGNGFGADLDALAENVRMICAAGVAGVSIEDATGDRNAPLFPLEVAVDRIRAAKAAIDQSGGDVLLVGRAENFLLGRPDLDEAVRRLRAYRDAGADCLYAPGVKQPDQIRLLVDAVSPNPLNLLVGSPSEMTVAEIANLGVRRISVGGALARVAIGSFTRAARELLDPGRFDALAGGVPGSELDAFFS